MLAWDSSDEMQKLFMAWADRRGVWPLLIHLEIFQEGWRAAQTQANARDLEQETLDMARAAGGDAAWL